MRWCEFYQHPFVQRGKNKEHVLKALVQECEPQLKIARDKKKNNGGNKEQAPQEVFEIIIHNNFNRKDLLVEQELQLILLQELGQIVPMEQLFSIKAMKLNKTMLMGQLKLKMLKTTTEFAELMSINLYRSKA